VEAWVGDSNARPVEPKRAPSERDSISSGPTGQRVHSAAENSRNAAVSWMLACRGQPTKRVTSKSPAYRPRISAASFASGGRRMSRGVRMGVATGMFSSLQLPYRKRITQLGSKMMDSERLESASRQAPLLLAKLSSRCMAVTTMVPSVRAVPKIRQRGFSFTWLTP